MAPILCHREPSQMAWRSSHNKVARSRVRALFTGLLRCARNDKGGVVLDCFAALAMTRVEWPRHNKGVL